MGAVARFATAGKAQMKKDLGLMAMTYGNVYVASVALGANPTQAVKAFVEAEAYNGPSIIIAYSHCIAHGIDMKEGLVNQKMAVQSGHFPLYRFNPMLTKEGKNPLILDSKAPSVKYSEAVMKENRFRVLKQTYPENNKRILEEADKLVIARFDLYQKLANLPPCTGEIKQ
jgi:pyruvate-ferredoxin/flavodoxin oxidoreductase